MRNRGNDRQVFVKIGKDDPCIGLGKCLYYTWLTEACQRLQSGKGQNKTAVMGFWAQKPKAELGHQPSRRQGLFLCRRAVNPPCHSLQKETCLSRSQWLGDTDTGRQDALAQGSGWNKVGADSGASPRSVPQNHMSFLSAASAKLSPATNQPCPWNLWTLRKVHASQSGPLKSPHQRLQLVISLPTILWVSLHISGTQQ